MSVMRSCCRNSGGRRCRRHLFTLTELVIVMVIIILISGIVIGRIGKIPAFASLDKQGAEVASFLRRCSLYASGSGREIRVAADAANRKLYVIQYVDPAGNGTAVYSELARTFAGIVDPDKARSGQGAATSGDGGSRTPAAELKNPEIILPESITLIVPEALDDSRVKTRDDDIDITAATVRKADSESEEAVIDPSEGPAIVFRFSPDGASSGGPVVLKLAGHAVEISASPL
ncbi:MAG: hypothetical protein PHQ27_06970, partial [Victivallales bacterium]|nr:hypothetical protein [Victivallales bacterium]